MPVRTSVTGPSVLKGTFSHPELKPLGLAVVDFESPIICCTTCEQLPYRILQYDECAKHVREHMMGTQACDSDEDIGPEREKAVIKRKPTIPYAVNEKAFIKRNFKIPSVAAINKILNKFELWMEPFWEIRLPTEVVAPFSFLRIQDAYRCLPCGAVITLKRTEATMRTHLIESHGSSESFETRTNLVKVQSFSDSRNHRRDFLVDPSLALAETQSQGVGPVADPAALARAWRAQTNPDAVIRAPKVVNIKTAPPFIVRSGWGEWVNALENVAECRALAHEPYEDDERRIYDQALTTFCEDHAALGSLPVIFRQRITMSEGETDSKPLDSKLDPKTIQRYGGCWASLIIFAIRVFRQQSTKQPTVPVTFTEDQQTWIKSVIKTASKKWPKWRHLLHGLSRYLWCDPAGFAHTTENQFADVTTAFSVLYCMRTDLTFGRTNDITHDLNALRFSMQQVILFWALNFRKNATDQVEYSVDWLQDFLKQELDYTRHGPFAALMSTYSLASNLSRTAEGMPNFIYEGKQDNAKATLGNKSISIRLWREGIRQMLRTFESFVTKDLLLDIDPSDLGFNFGPEKMIFDNYSRRDAGYSFLTDRRNCFCEWTYALSSRMFANPKASCMFEKQRDANGKVVLNERRVDQWLCDYSYAIRGQPSRGAEFVLVRLMNDGWRVRNVYMMSNGRLAIVLFYTKVSSMTGKDRVVAYCVPWRITRLFIIIYGLVHPFVKQILEVLLEGEAADDARRTHEVYMFALRGHMHTSAQLSDDLKSFYSNTCGEELGVRDNRHFMIGVMRHETPLSKGPAERALALIDLQAGHGPGVAGMFYAVEASAAHELTNEQLSGFFICSLVWYSFVMGDDSDGLTPEDVAEIQRASLPGGHPTITGTNLYPLAGVADPEMQMRIVNELTNQALDRQRAAIYADTDTLISSKLVALETRFLAATRKHRPPPAPAVDVKHKVLLWKYLGSCYGLGYLRIK
ncbi:ATP-dependent DNA helicase tlh2 [Ceratobasidium sp. AG-Ba]|nr:ATP-dependent DNA helicase tlh2 [Ceratobasidium sp. AG-Ba]